MQAIDTNFPVTARIDDYDDICRAVQLYMEGVAKGDVNKLEAAFHPDARMFGDFRGTRYDIPIAQLFRLSERMPADSGKYRGRIISVSQTGDVAFAAVAEDGCWGTVSFVDYFLLTCIKTGPLANASRCLVKSISVESRYGRVI